MEKSSEVMPKVVTGSLTEMVADESFQLKSLYDI